MALAEKAFTAFEKDLTFSNFYKVCVLIRCDDSELQCEDTLGDLGYKIPTPELKKILEFITTKGRHSKWGNCGFSTRVIMGSHHQFSAWKGMSSERLECLSHYFGDYFWNDFIEAEKMRNVRDLSPEDFHTVFDILLKSEGQK